MSDFESFLGLDENEGGASPEAIEHMREQMKKASAAIQASKKKEAKQKKKEGKLADLLVKLIKGGTKQDVLNLIIQLLQENVPAAFILALLVLSNEEIKKEAKKELKLEHYDDPEKKLLKGEKIDLSKEEKKIFRKKESELEDLEGSKTLPPSMLKDINEWGEMILAAGLSIPHKTLGTVLDKEKKIKAPVVQLTAFSLRDYFEIHGIEKPYNDLWEFSAAMLRSIMTKLNRAAKDIPEEKLPELNIEQLKEGKKKD